VTITKALGGYVYFRPVCRNVQTPPPVTQFVALTPPDYEEAVTDEVPSPSRRMIDARMVPLVLPLVCSAA